MRIAAALVVTVILGGVGSYLLAPALADARTLGSALIFVSAGALVLSTVAAFAGFQALYKATALKSELRMLARSVDRSLRDLDLRSARDTVTIRDMNEVVARELDQISSKLQARAVAYETEIEAVLPQGDNIVHHPASRLARRGISTTAGAERGHVENGVRRIAGGGAFDLSLQPIISVRANAVAGFETFAYLPIDGSEAIDLRRLANAIPGVEAAAFERALIVAAVEAGRRRVGVASETTPLHAAMSDSILNDGREMATLLEMFALYPALTRSLILSGEASLFAMNGPHAQALSLLADSGVRFASEGWIDRQTIKAAASHVSYLKITANRLLEREPSDRRAEPVSAILEFAAASDVQIIATDLRSDEDAVSLIDLGIDLMVGPRFSGPKLLKPEESIQSSRLALI